MWALFQSNPTMVAILIAVVLAVIALHVGVYWAIRRLARRDMSAAADDDSTLTK